MPNSHAGNTSERSHHTGTYTGDGVKSAPGAGATGAQALFFSGFKAHRASELANFDVQRTPGHSQSGKCSQKFMRTVPVNSP